MEASEPKWVNPNDIQYGVNSLRLGGLHIHCSYPSIINLQDSEKKNITFDFEYLKNNIIP